VPFSIYKCETPVWKNSVREKVNMSGYHRSEKKRKVLDIDEKEGNVRRNSRERRKRRGVWGRAVCDQRPQHGGHFIVDQCPPFVTLVAILSMHSIME
jgi:hypothetical protein